MFEYRKAAFTYEPYPVCYISDFLPTDLYGRLAATFPKTELFEYKPSLGDKYSLAERNNGDKYRSFLAANSDWQNLYSYVKSEKFVHDTLEFLKRSHIDLGLNEFKFTTGRHASLLSRVNRQTELGARFEFSAMGGSGGCILPHTDHPNKLVTFVISMVGEEGWDQGWGGGTQTCLPKDRTRIYNQMNRYMEFDEVDVVKSYPFLPNQCILFIKTYNSWHQVAPIHSPPGSPLRKTLTINIELIK